MGCAGLAGIHRCAHHFLFDGGEAGTVIKSTTYRYASASAIYPRQHADGSMLTGSHIGILSINDRVAHVYFHLMGPGRDVHDLRMIVDRQRLCGLRTIDEYDGTRGSAGHDDFGRIRHLRLSMEPTAG